MKFKTIILSLCLLVLSSCIVKSLQPFYTKDKLAFNEKLMGKWTDQKKGNWRVNSFLEMFNAERDMDEPLSEQDQKIYDNYKDGYIIYYSKNNKEAAFIAMPFKIEEQYFIDFIPFDYDTNEINSLAAEHLLKTHSVAKLDINSDDEFMLSWLDEDRIKHLFEDDKIRLKHENIGWEETLLLTASSSELYDFLKKYMKADIDDKWKVSDRLTLSKQDAKP